MIRPLSILVSATLCCALFLNARADDETPTPKSIAPQAVELLAAVDKKVTSISSISAHVVATMKPDGGKNIIDISDVKFQRPNLLSAQVSRQTDNSTTPLQAFVCDGQNLWLIEDYAKRKYIRQAAPRRLITGHDAVDRRPFFVVNDYFWSTWRDFEGADEVTYDGKQSWDGAQYDVVTIRYFGGTERIFIGSDKLVHRLITTNSMFNGTADYHILQLTTNQPFAARQFKFHSPAGFKPTTNLSFHSFP